MSKIQLPALFQQSMVLQRRKAICVWGEAEDCASVEVTLGGHTACARVEKGRWKTFLPPMEAAVGLVLQISGGDCRLCIGDVAVGEVWIAGGQSNMEFLLKYDAEAAASCALQNPDVRCFEVPKIAFPGQETYFKMSAAGFWRKEQPAESPDFTAVGFYFANRLYEALQVPVGILNCTWGGTSASCWVSEGYLTGELQFYLDRARAVQASLDRDAAFAEFVAMQKKMLAGDFDMGTPHLAPLEFQIDEATHEHLMAMNNWPFSPFRPCGLHESMLRTIVPFTVSGVLWYQGESDEYFSEHYESVMRAVVHCWRDDWGEALPFLMVQLASFEVMAEHLDFVPIRRAQERLARSEPGVYLATAADAGMRYDIHPKRKRPVGERLALQALDKVYGCHVQADSPTVLAAHRDGDTVVLRMKHSGGGLHVVGGEAATFDVYADGGAVSAYAVSVLPQEIILRAEAFASARSIRIAFCQRPWFELTIFSGAGLPVLPFDVELS